jgi:hypothetical protein
MATAINHPEELVSYFVDLDVSLDETAICIVDDAGDILKEGKAETDPEAIATWTALKTAGNSGRSLIPCCWGTRGISNGGTAGLFRR